ncbi:hypothetical protein V6N12_028146 [Hibiscus sabdariffa]|uniref:Uncharacterized protein n=1 Tax=Hibiscus sabdariffa TaxID=183260 RepID=A0ABR2F4Z5_9ROSI
MPTMKTTTASLFLLFIFSITQSSFPVGVANAAGDVVLDVNGDEVLTGAQYYVVSAIWGAGGGGLSIGWESDRRCPGIVVQSRFDLDNGSPVTLPNIDGVEGTRSGRIVRKKVGVELGGSEGEPGCDTVESWFKIERVFKDGTYKFKYCPSVCDSAVTSCNEIERDVDSDGQVRLAVSDGRGYPWIFIKADARIRQVVRA